MAVNVVLGAGGGTGLECVKRLVAKGLPARAVVRDPSKYQGVFPDGVEVVAGDVSDKASLEKALANARSVIFAAAGRGYWTPAEVDFKGVAHVAEVAKQVGAQHMVLVSSMLVTRKNWWNPIRIMLNNIRYSLIDNKLKGEEALRTSGMAYTILRPGGLAKGAGGHATIHTAQGDNIAAPKAINRADVAAVAVAALTAPAARNVTVEVWGSPAPGLATEDYDKQLKEMWSTLTADALSK